MPGGLGVWSMGIIGGSTRANSPTRRGRGGRLLGATCGIIENKHGWALIRAWALNRDNTVILCNLEGYMPLM